MNILRADVTDIPVVSLGDDVVLINHQGNEEVLVEKPGSSSDMINHEFFPQLSRVIQRSVV
jgi:alanine racemase